MKAVVIGGSGATGKPLICQLLAGEPVSEVTALLRKETFGHHPKLRQEIVDFDRIEDFGDKIDAEIAFSCMGTTLKIAGSKEAQWKVDFGYQYRFARLCRERGVSTFVLLSAVNADPDSRFFYSKMKGKLEKEVEKLGFQRLIIFQPGLLIRPGTDRKREMIGVKAMQIINKWGLLNWGFLEKLNPLDVADLAKAMIQSVMEIQGMKEKGCHIENQDNLKNQGIIEKQNTVPQSTMDYDEPVRRIAVPEIQHLYRQI